METTERLRLQQEGVQLTREGRYQEAVLALKQARYDSSGIERANIDRDLADVIRRLGREEEAKALISLSIEELEPYRDQYPVEYASSVHFRARLARQLGDGSRAIEDARWAWSMITTANLEREAGQPFHPQELWIGLDYAALVATELEHTKRVRSLAWSCLKLAIKLARDPATKDVVNRSHILRALLILLFAGNPTFNWEPVHRAFYGRS